MPRPSWRSHVRPQLERLERRDAPAVVTLTNGLTSADNGFVSVDFTEGGAKAPTGGAGSSFTNAGLTSQFVFDHINFIDVSPGVSGGTFALLGELPSADGVSAPGSVPAGPSAVITMPATLMGDRVVSEGSFVGPNGTIRWRAESILTPGSQNVINRISFSSDTPFGDVRLINYFDGIIGAEEDILRVASGTGASGIDLLAITPNDGTGASQRGPVEGGISLQGASFVGFAATPFDGAQSILRITNEELTYLPQPVVGSNIDAAFPAFVDPQFGPVFGSPNSPIITTALAYDLDPNATLAVIETNFGFVANVNAQPAGDFFAASAGAGGGPAVNLFNADGTLRASFFAYDPAFVGGVRVALGDVNGDGVPDIITTPGPGGPPLVRVFDGTNLALLNQFLAYPDIFTGGVFVAAGDVDNDGRLDIVTAPGSLGGPVVSVFDAATGQLKSSFFAYDPMLISGVRIALGDTNGSEQLKIVTAPGPSGGPNVKVFDPSGVEEQSFFAFDPSFLAGLFVTTADTNGDGIDEIVVAPDNFDNFAGSILFDLLTGIASVQGGSVQQLLDPTSTNFQLGPLVRVFSQGTLLQEFQAFPADFLQGVRLGSADFNGDGIDDILVAAGDGGPPVVQVIGLNDNLQFGIKQTILAFDPTFLGGVYVAG